MIYLRTEKTLKYICLVVYLVLSYSLILRCYQLLNSLSFHIIAIFLWNSIIMISFVISNLYWVRIFTFWVWFWERSFEITYYIRLNPCTVGLKNLKTVENQTSAYNNSCVTLKQTVDSELHDPLANLSGASGMLLRMTKRGKDCIRLLTQLSPIQNELYKLLYLKSIKYQSRKSLLYSYS